MHIQKFSIINYKSYLSPKEIQLSQGFNVIIGPNNAGKTAMIEALSLRFEDKSHRSLETIPTPGGSPTGVSQIYTTFEVPKDELRQLVFENWREFRIRRNPEEFVQTLTDRVHQAFLLPAVHIDGVYQPNAYTSSQIIEMDASVQSDMGSLFKLESLTSLPTVTYPNVAITDSQILARPLIDTCRQRVYYFRAERLNIGQYSVGDDSVLKPDASNLPQAMHMLQTSNPIRFTRLIELVKIVFPDIKQITVPPMRGNPNQVRILLWYIDPSSEREDLALPLQESGTGISQVLAILYVAITSEFPRPILIDEPQSFLHPTAIRKLFDILRHKFPQHQYIVTTHSPIVVSVANPDNLIMLRKEDTKTQIHLINKHDAGELRIVLAEVGARVSDVFGAEKILWVEGSTEENSFPLIVSGILNKPLLGVSILGVLHTGDFEGKLAKNVYRIYKKLSEGGSLLPPAIGFVFDGENRTATEKEDIVRESEGKVNFLPRRMYENYLINPDAVFGLITKLDNFSDQQVTPESITGWIEENKWKNDYFDDAKFAITKDHSKWAECVHGAKLLNDLLKSLSNGKYTYDKVRHGVVLTSWFVSNAPEELNEVATILDKILSS